MEAENNVECISSRTELSVSHCYSTMLCKQDIVHYTLQCTDSTQYETGSKYLLQLNCHKQWDCIKFELSSRAARSGIGEGGDNWYKYVTTVRYEIICHWCVISQWLLLYVLLTTLPPHVGAIRCLKDGQVHVNKYMGMNMKMQTHMYNKLSTIVLYNKKKEIISLKLKDFILH